MFLHSRLQKQQGAGWGWNTYLERARPDAYQGSTADVVSTTPSPPSKEATEQTPLRLELEPELYYNAYTS